MRFRSAWSVRLLFAAVVACNAVPYLTDEAFLPGVVVGVWLAVGVVEFALWKRGRA